MGNKVFKIRGYDEFGQEVFKKDVVGTYEDACDYMYEYAWRSNYPDDNELGKVERLELIIPQEYEDFTVEKENASK